MLVPANLHVLDMDIREIRGKFANFGGNWQFGLAMKVADVQRQPKVGNIHPASGQASSEVAVGVQLVDKHARLGLEGDNYLFSGGVDQNLRQAVYEAAHCFIIACAVVDDPGPDGDATRI